MVNKVRVALLGAGIFARDVWSKTITGTHLDGVEVELMAVWSRGSEAAQALAAQLSTSDYHGESGLTSILQDPGIDLVIVVLPVQVALPIVKRALAAGKHVLEEKPVSGTCEEAAEAILEYRVALKKGGPFWMIAENYRFEDVFKEACRLIPDCGSIIKLDLVAEMPMDPNNKYFHTAWRKDTQGCPGGMVMESSVHFIAALRMLAAAAGLGEAMEASARTTHARPDLSGPDSIVGFLTFGQPGGGEATGNVAASVSISLASSHVHWALRVIGINGTIEVGRGGWTGTRAGYTLTRKYRGDAEHVSHVMTFTGVTNEYLAALKTVLTGEEDPRGSPEEGARDLAAVQALLESGAKGGVIVSIARIP